MSRRWRVLRRPASPRRTWRRRLRAAEFASALLLAASALAAAGCEPFGFLAGRTARLVVDMASGARRKTIAPSGFDLSVASYELRGSGPKGESFEVVGIGSSIFSREGLAPGLWNIRAAGKNADGEGIVESETAVVELKPGETRQISLSCSVWTGTGNLSAELSWPEALGLSNPAVEGTLTGPGGASADLCFAVEGASAAWANSEPLPSGYYLLAVGLKNPGEAGRLLWSKVEAVLVAAGRTTAAGWSLSEADISPAPGG